MEGLFNDIWLNNAQKELNEFLKLRENALRRLFNKRIKQSFLIEILHRVEAKWDTITSYFNMNFDSISMISGQGDYIHYEICRMIVGIHRSNCIFLKDDERRNKEKDESYKKELVNNVINHIKLRSYSSSLFRNKQIMPGDEFLYFPVPYTLFSICVKAIELLDKNRDNNKINHFYFNIFSKSLAALTLIEDNFLDNAYPICRVIIEFYFKLLLVEKNPTLIKEHDIFTKYDFEKGCCGIDYPSGFEEKFKNRKCKNDNNKVNFLHYGWLDSLEDYHSFVKHSPYSINGIIAYIENKYEFDIDFQSMRYFYKMCHSYTHGNVVMARYPLLHYFELCIILTVVIGKTYRLLCEHLECLNFINGVDVLGELKKSFDLLQKQYSQRSTDNFDNYYKGLS